MGYVIIYEVTGGLINPWTGEDLSAVINDDNDENSGPGEYLMIITVYKVVFFVFFYGSFIIVILLSLCVFLLTNHNFSMSHLIATTLVDAAIDFCPIRESKSRRHGLRVTY
jgi:sensor histidine kinase YesM